MWTPSICNRQRGERHVYLLLSRARRFFSLFTASPVALPLLWVVFGGRAAPPKKGRRTWTADLFTRLFSFVGSAQSQQITATAIWHTAPWSSICLLLTGDWRATATHTSQEVDLLLPMELARNASGEFGMFSKFRLTHFSTSGNKNHPIIPVSLANKCSLGHPSHLVAGTGGKK